MDRIFHKTTNVFNVVSRAREEPHMYGKKGELLRHLDDLEDNNVRRASVMNHDNKENEKDSDQTTADERE